MTEKKKTCFIIMPITTPDLWLDTYGGDKDHFKHILEHLFIPAVEAAGLKAIPPEANGSELIHARIIKHLETANMVLCDISILNPNVFFELGIRTALNKPVCHVKDNVTPKPPFDTGIINHHEYESHPIWTQEQEIKKLTDHIQTTIEQSSDSNSMWEYFGLKTIAKPTEPKTGTEAALEMMRMDIAKISNSLTEARTNDTSEYRRSFITSEFPPPSPTFLTSYPLPTKKQKDLIAQTVHQYLSNSFALSSSHLTWTSIGELQVHIFPMPDTNTLAKLSNDIKKIMADYGVKTDGVAFVLLRNEKS